MVLNRLSIATFTTSMNPLANVHQPGWLGAGGIREKINFCARQLREIAADIWGFQELMILRSRGDDPQTSQISVNIDRFSRPILHFKVRPRPNNATHSMYSPANRAI